MRCLLVASIFPPINGGSAVVYETLCRFAPAGSMLVLAPWRHYVDGNEIVDWRSHDASLPYFVHRIELLRPPILEPPKHSLQSLWRLLRQDLPLRIKVFLEVRRLVRKYNIDVVCIGELASISWIGIVSQRFLGCKMISYIHGEEVTTETEYRFFGRRRKKYLHRADAVVAVSQFTKDALMRLMAVPAEKITLIHNGVDTEKFLPGAKSRYLIERHKLQGKQVILTVGRIVPRKGLDAVIRALPNILRQAPATHYLIVGEGHYRPVLERIVEQLGMRDHVTFAGRVAEEELADYYRTCDVFAMPNREMPDGDTEGFGLVFLEANACRKPVVGGRAGGAVEAVRDGENGLLVDGWSVDEIAEALLRLLTDSVLSERISTRGLEIAQASSSRVKAEQFHALCKDLVA